ncbi:MAG: CAP domain-containing protein, partial [Pseudomonadota bacterium]
DLVDYVQEAKTCLAAATGQRGDLAEALLTRINEKRDAAGARPLTANEGFTLAAEAHALDMGQRGYVTHADLEGRSHTYRVAAFDRQSLIGSSGAIIAITKANASTDDILSALQSDAANRANLMRADFNTTGLAVFERGEKLIIVQTLARVDGTLKAPLPLTIAQSTPIRATLDERYQTIESWGVTDMKTREQIAKGNALRLRPVRLKDAAVAGLSLTALSGEDAYTLKGPLVSAD